MPNQNESLNVSAKTVDKAIELGLSQLKLTREQVDIKIIKEGKRGVVFGFGAEDAQVRLTFNRQQPELLPNEEDSVLPEETEEDSPAVLEPEPEAHISELVEELTETDMEQEQTTEEVAVKYLTNILNYMGVEAEVSSRLGTDLTDEGEKPPLVLDITGNDLGILIGRHSETLQSLQHIIRLMVSNQFNSRQNIVVDVEAYRVRRRHSLLHIAENMTERVVASGRKVVLEAMLPYERRIIHIFLKDHPDVFTKSVGSDDNRKVTIIPK